jgi:hypothetical protein
MDVHTERGRDKCWSAPVRWEVLRRHSAAQRRRPDKRADRRVVVIVVATKSSPLHQELMQIRGEKKLHKMWDRMGP